MKKKITIGLSLVGAAIFGATIVGWSTAKQDTKPSDSAKSASVHFSKLQTDEIRDIVRAYILENPDVLIESVNSYSEQQRNAAEVQAKVQAKANLTALLDPSTGFVAAKSPDDAKVAVIELFDYHCGYCKKATGYVSKLATTDKDVKVVFRELPILRPESEYAAEIALAARNQGKFLDMHFAMMDAKGTLTPDRVKEIATTHKVDVDKLLSDRQSDEVVSAIRENHRIASAMQANGTPTFIVATLDGSYVEVLQGYSEEALKAHVADAKKAAK